MALNKFMHPRNIYRNPPDFAKMSHKYPEFAEIVTKDVSGKVSVNFKDPQCLRVLTKYLLKTDFDLDVVIPEDRLVPTLPLRLNYILWIEDLLNSIQRHENVTGIDIGTGACAIYPLLAAVKYKWHMVATESDTDSLSKAKSNVENNNLQEFITLKYNNTNYAIQHLLLAEESQNYDFCMCNPPFYSSIEELCESRSMARPPPKNAFTGSPQELITKGGELEFIRNLIMESKSHKNNILIYTTMVGHKYNLKELLQDLKSDGIVHTHTEFCQGRVTRWGVAWTYQDYDLYKLVPPRDKERKKSTPITFAIPFPQDTPNKFESVLSKLKTILSDLNITFKTLNKKESSLSFNMIAKENTWSNQRRKRRLMKRLGAEESKKPKLEVNNAEACEKPLCKLEKRDKRNLSGDNREMIHESQATNGQKEAYESLCAGDGKKEASENSAHKNPPGIVEKKPCESRIAKYKDSTSSSCIGKLEVNKLPQNIVQTESKPIVRSYTKVYMKENNVTLEMEFLDGTGGKECLHQIAQYIKNNIKFR